MFGPQTLSNAKHCGYWGGLGARGLEARGSGAGGLGGCDVSCQNWKLKA